MATLGLNPSRVEFLSPDGNELVGADRRLATRTSLGRPHPAALTEDNAVEVVADCDTYFERNPYMRWFNDLERVANAVGASFFAAKGGGTCHLDIAQWATDPVWGRLRTDQRRR